MRLIDVKTLQLSEFFGEDIPPYAILSHRWGCDEVGFEIFSNSLEEARGLKGFKKILYCADQATEDGLSWCWVDTCCIDKRSSSELSEAINSMYQWYKSAVCCYAYLEDISVPSDAEIWGPYSRQIFSSEWFSRGWTLQELIAPKYLRFFSATWTELGDKTELSGLIARHCGIDEKVLLQKISVDRVNIAQRMRWASTRKTTRIEDVAYSLMGIFDVNMPLLYGEGRKAFTRLQEEIIKQSSDQSIFSWINRGASRKTLRGLLAQSPAEFRHSVNVRTVPDIACEPFAATNRGLSISLPLQRLGEDELEYLGILSCQFLHSENQLAVRLRRTFAGSNQFIRVDPYRLYQVSSKSPPIKVYVPEKIPSLLTACDRAACFRLNMTLRSRTLSSVWSQEGCQRDGDLIRFTHQSSSGYYMARLLFDYKCRPEKTLVVLVYNPSKAPITLAAGSFGSGLRVVQPSSGAASAGDATEAYDVNKMPSPGEIIWGQHAGWVSTEVDQEIVGDELVFNVNMELCDSDRGGYK
jgi:hypothetical protein